MSNLEPILVQLKGIKKVFLADAMQIHALNAIDLEIRRNEFLAITGPSGCGKSTLLSILGLLDSPTAGTYTLNGRAVAELSNSEAVMELLSAMHRDGATICMVTHDDCFTTRAQRIVQLLDGKVVKRQWGCEAAVLLLTGPLRAFATGATAGFGEDFFRKRVTVLSPVRGRSPGKTLQGVAEGVGFEPTDPCGSPVF